MLRLIFSLDYMEDARTVFDFGFKNGERGGIDFKKIIFKEVKELSKFKKSRNVKNKILTLIKNEYIKKGKQLLRAKNDYENIWNSFESSKLENSLPKYKKKITVYISLFNCNPKYIERNSFQMYYKMNKKEALATMCHELVHFIYFDIYKKLFPKDPLTDAQSWALSEIIDVIILKDIGMYAGIYPEHIKFIPLFEKIWLTEKNNGFSIFLKKAVHLAKCVL